MDQLTVFRLENSQGQGPYTDYDNEISYELCRAHNGHDHPCPEEDNKLGYIERGSEFCGFKTRKELEDWFAGWLPKLGRAGYLIAEYAVPRKHVRIGRTQVLFKRQLASRISETRPH